MKNMRVFIAEEDQDVRVGLQMLLNRQPGLQVVGIATRSDSLVGQVGAAQADIVLLDWELVTAAPEDYIKNLHSLSSQPSIIVLHVRPETRDAAIAAGADDFSSKDQPPDQLLECLQLIKHERIQINKFEGGELMK